MMPPETAPSEIELNQEKEKDREERRRIIIALLFLLLSFSCIFCASQSALWLIDRSRIGASMLSGQRADYGGDVSLELAPLEGDIAAEAEHDEALLLLKQTPMAGGLGVVILPNPLPTPAPTVIALLPTPTPTPTVAEPPESGPSTPLPSAPTSTSVAPPPTSPPPTSSPPTSLPPTSPPPTAPPPTVPPTSPPPTVPPPTSPPPTSPPPTSPPPTATPTATATATATPTPTNTPIPPSVQFSSSAYTVAEGDVGSSLAMINVTLSAASALTVTVNYATSDGTATAGSDYIGVSSTLTFSPGQTNQTFAVSILGDTVDELDETVVLTLSAPTNATLGVPNPATLTITDDDDPPTVQFSAPTYTVGEAGGTAPITVTLSSASALMVTVEYTASNGTAIAGSDYIPITGTLTFTPGVINQFFSVTIINDAGLELPPDETVNLTLGNPTNATIAGTNPATLTITDDDPQPCSIPPDSGANPPGVVDIGPPDCRWTDIGASTIITDVTATGGPPITVDLSDPDFDLIYYERESPTPGQIALDQVIIWVSPNGSDWYQVFYWGDGGPDTNTNVGQAGFSGPEVDDTPIPMSDPPLYRSSTGPITGIAIDVDAPLAAVPPPTSPPPGPYPYVRITGINLAEVDSIEVLP